MSNKTCLGCGGQTNTTVCDYLAHRDLKPRKCFAKWDGGRWVKGCGYDQANEYMDDMQVWVDSVIGERKVREE